MDSEKLLLDYYLTKEYEKKSETEFVCKIYIKKRIDDSVVTSIGNSIDILETEENISNSKLAISNVTWENYLDETVIMLFNLLMFQINLIDMENIEGKSSISSFFDEYPFYE